MSDLDHELPVAPDVYPPQRALLPRWWAVFDRYLLLLTNIVVFLVGFVFCLFVSAEAVSRYFFSFSIFFVNAGSKILLIWFFFLGAGPALREGSQMGITIITDRLSPRFRKAAVLAGGVLSAVFLAMIFYSSLLMLGPGLMMIEPSLGIHLFWGFLAVPVSFGLLSYHLLTLMIVAIRQPLESPVV